MTTTDDILDLRARVEALEQRAATEESSAIEPAPAPAADGPLWQVMRDAHGTCIPDSLGYAAEIDAVADWLAARGCAGSADMLRTEARRARGEA